MAIYVELRWDEPLDTGRESMRDVVPGREQVEHEAKQARGRAEYYYMSVDKQKPVQLSLR